MARILVADDDGDIRELVAFKLEQAGFEVVAVADGDAALAASQTDPPDLAVLDVMMPRRSGIDVTRELRSADPTRSIPVLLLTARAQETDIDAGFEAGADDYMVKPFSPRELLTRVRSMLQRKGT